MSGRPPFTDVVAQAVQVLQAGGVVGYPTETVWGLAALPTLAAAVGRLYQLKGRSAHKPVQLSCVDAAHARHWLRPDGDTVQDVARLERFWPGPLTVLAWAAPGTPEQLAPGGVVGLRVPAAPTALALLAATGGTLATTSLNPSGQPAARTAQEARAYRLADLLLPADEGVAVSGQSSTVFDVRTRQVVRPGAVSEQALLEALG